MPALLYQHAESTRRPIVAVAAILGAAMSWVGWSYGAPAGFLVVTLFSTLFATGFFVLGRRSGSRIDREGLFFFAGRWEKRIPVADVNSYRRTPWTESQDWIHLRGPGEDEWLVPAYCVGDVGRFTAALDTLGVPQEA
jgi:hypothetical protein